MNPAIYQRCQVVATRCKLKPEGCIGPRFVLELKFSETSQPVIFDAVHLSQEAQDLIAGGRVTGASVEVLCTNTLPSSLLGNCRHLVTGLELDDGRLVETIPEVLVRTRRLGIFASTAATIGAAACLFAGWQAAVPTIALVLATHALRSVLAIPNKSFPGLHVHLALNR